ncbi:hypothetical protein [Euryhalocaulis caribicus]|uniref:hypothetical protein n=1 Tax=Euryhalocaulis caribicus TaxID=1161401 RepID=UPI001F51F9F7|nr:hypothetical protein [Euryhalocaulis caribicus]
MGDLLAQCVNSGSGPLPSVIPENESRWRLVLRGKRYDPLGEHLRVARLLAVGLLDERAVLRDRLRQRPNRISPAEVRLIWRVVL